MDFGDILEQWSQSQKTNSKKNNAQKQANQVSHKKANAPTAEEKALIAQGYKKTARGQMEEDAKKQ